MTGFRDPKWLNGQVASCACPECGAPMTIRLWLSTADCWRCQISISLAYLVDEQSSTADSFSCTAPDFPTAKHQADRRLDNIPAPRSPTPRKSALHPLKKNTRQPTPQNATPPRWTNPVPPQFVLRGPVNWTTRLHDVVAWLLSTAAHLMLLILLALSTLSGPEKSEQIQLSLHIDPIRIEGELEEQEPVVRHIGFKLPVEEVPPLPPDPEALEAQMWADQLVVAAEDPAPNLPELNRVIEAVESENQYWRMLSSRDPRIRKELIDQEGGTSRTEAAVARALRWITLHQHPNGSWPLDAFHEAPACDGQCRDAGRIRTEPGGTALALQALLGAGQTHTYGIYRDAVSDGLRYLLEIQTESGDLRGNTRANAGMYVQALAAIALADALAMTGDKRLVAPAQNAIDFIAASQNDAGGWRYRPGESGDTSVIGWQLMAMHSGRAAGLEVSNLALIGASFYLDSAQVDQEGAFYSYQPGSGFSEVMTAEGLLSRMYLGWQRQNRGLRRGVLQLAEDFPPIRSDPNIYYWYYATQVMHHWGGPVWTRWNQQMRDVLVESQATQGHEAGSWWYPGTPHGGRGGRLYMTALACCTLEVYYRHAPLFRKIKLN
jgi:hypothetical protein